MRLLKSLRRALHKKRTFKLKMKGGGGDGNSDNQLEHASSFVGGRRRRRTGRRRTRTGRSREGCLKHK